MTIWCRNAIITIASCVYGEGAVSGYIYMVILPGL